MTKFLRPQLPRRQFYNLLTVAAILGLCLFLSFIAANLKQEREAAFQSAQSRTENISRLMQEHMAASVQSIDLALQGIHSHLQPGDVLQARTDTRRLQDIQRHLQGILERAPQVTAFSVVDAQGDFVFSTSHPLPKANLSDRFHFQFLKEHPGSTMLVPPPVVSRTIGTWAMPFSRRIEFADGRFAGIIVATVDLNYFSKFYATLNLGQHGTLVLRDQALRLLARYPESNEKWGQAIPHHHAEPYLAQGLREATYTAHGQVDDTQRLYTFRQVGEHPLYVFAGLAETDFLAEWRMHFRYYLILALVVTLLVTALILLVRRYRRQMEGTLGELLQRERELEQHRDHLEEEVASRTRQLTQAEARIRLILESTPDGLLGFDLSGRINFINRAACQLLGYEHNVLIGQDTHLTLHHSHADGEPYPRTECPILASLSKGAVVRSDTEVLWRADNTALPVSYACTPIVEEGVVISALMGFSDISARLEAEKARQRFENEMQHAKEAAEASNLAKSSFLANMSHEIRTPMNAIIGMTHLALKTELTRVQRNYLQKVQGAGQHLLGIINDILDYSKIEAGKLVIERREFDLDEVFDNIACQLGEKVASKELELVIDVDRSLPSRVVGDSLRLSQVLLNLGSNAVKFTDHGEIVISVRGEMLPNQKILLQCSVRDTGVGLTEEQIGRLFQSFEQADNSTTRKFGGTGLGLAISKRMVELMGGEIQVTSQYGQGSTFSFSVLCEIASVQSRPRQTTPDMRGRHVLVVDDNIFALEVMTTMLKSMSFRVEAAGSGMAALELVQQCERHDDPFDVMFLDWHMPEMDGIVTARQIRDLRLAKLPLMIMVTAYGRDDLVEAAQKVGIRDILAKPVTASSLFDSLITNLSQEGANLPSLSRSPLAEGETESLKGLQGARLLLVEDNELNQEVAVSLLEGTGMYVDVAENGAVALEKLANADYDLVLMDMQMPVMDGITCTLEIRKQSRLNKMPIIAMTANVMSADRERCLGAGMNDHLAKPIDPDALMSTLIRWIKPRLSVSLAEPHRVQADAADCKLVEALSGIAGLDVRTGLHLARGRPGLYVKLLRKYVTGQAGFAEQLDAALERFDQGTAVRLAHTLKSVSGQIGAETLRRLASLLERAIKEGEPRPVFEALRQQIAEVLNSLLPAIADVLPEDIGDDLSPIGPFDQTLFDEVCGLLDKQLQAGDFEAGNTLKSHQHLFRQGLGVRYALIQPLVDAFDFEQAQQVLSSHLPSQNSC